MKLSTKARHAITAMMDLALNNKVRPITLAEISRSQGISLSYLEQLFAKLRKSGLVVGVRGPGGGYKLASGPDEITVAQIISAIDEYHPKLVSDASMEADSVSSAVTAVTNRYVTHVMWDELSEKIYAFLNSITLAEFAQRNDPNNSSDNNSNEVFSALTAA